MKESLHSLVLILVSLLPTTVASRGEVGTEVDAQTNGWIDIASEHEAATFGEFMISTVLCLAMVILISAIAYLSVAAVVTIVISGLP